MRFAIASADGVAMSRHFGRSQCFVVFDVSDGRASRSEVRDNTFTAHAKGECDDGEHHDHDQPHSHGDIVAALKDCRAVVCGGMGRRAAEELRANGIEPVMADPALSLGQVAHAFAAGTLDVRTSFCGCHD